MRDLPGTRIITITICNSDDATQSKFSCIIDRLYVSRKEGERKLDGIKDSVNASIQLLEDYIKKKGARMITATRNNTGNTSINKTKITRKQKWE